MVLAPPLVVARMSPPRTVPLSRFAPAASPWDVQPVARLDPDGRVTWMGRVLLPPASWESRCILVAWRPGAREPFRLLRGALSREGRAWRFEGGDGEAAWVILVEPEA